MLHMLGISEAENTGICLRFQSFSTQVTGEILHSWSGIYEHHCIKQPRQTESIITSMGKKKTSIEAVLKARSF